MADQPLRSGIDLSVVAPCFNEEANVPLLVARLLAVFDRRRIAGEIVLVNDCSTDATGRVVDSLAANHPEVIAIHHPRNRGLAAGWNTGLAAARGICVCFIDADLQNPPEEVWRLYREITMSRADMVQGVRSSIGRLKDGRYVTSRVLNVMLNLMFGMSAVDNKSGFVMARRDTMKDVLSRRFRYRHSHVFVAVAAHAKGFTTREVETLFQSRHAGKSFIKDWPVKLVTEVCLDTAKAFVEFRLSCQRIDELDQFLATIESRREPGYSERWRRFALGLDVLLRPFKSQPITRRVRYMYDALMKTQWASSRQVRRLQEVRLRRMIRQAYHHVPYYREMFDRLGIRPEEIVTLSDLRKLPVLSKDDVREYLYFDLFADNHRKRDMHKVTTAGADGETLDLYVDRMQREMRLAGALRARTWAGSVSEYGSPECRGIAYECDAHDGYHVAAESYIVEVLNDGQLARPGEAGDVVITDLDGFSVPLIRYRTGDRAVMVEQTCACGRGLLRIAPVQRQLAVGRESWSAPAQLPVSIGRAHRGLRV
jgi:glycosyltransferase involved in cell wall biosynthesis